MPKPTPEELRASLQMLDVTFGDCLQAFALDNTPEDQAFIDIAHANQRDGELEVDDLTIVSRSDSGAYVQCWMWVSNEEAGIATDDDE